jgi:hypothetical protein
MSSMIPYHYVPVLRNLFLEASDVCVETGLPCMSCIIKLNGLVALS